MTKSERREKINMINKIRTKTKILLFDIEISPSTGYSWRKFETNIIEYTEEWYILCYTAKWLNNKKMTVSALPQYKGRYRKSKVDDYDVVLSLWHLLDEADVVIAHNADFDTKKANARFAFHGLKPPSPYKVICTLKVARKYFSFNSNRLDDLGEHLGLGRKIETNFSLWRGCMNGDMNSWRRMVRYNKQDVKLLEKVYLRMLPFISTHPNVNTLTKVNGSCPNCGSSNLQKRGFAITGATRKQRLQCISCGRWSQSIIKGEKGVDVR